MNHNEHDRRAFFDALRTAILTLIAIGLIYGLLKAASGGGI